MFNLSSLKALDGKIALHHHETIESNESFTYQQIRSDSLAVKNFLGRFRSESDKSDQKWRQYNVLIALSTHSPALLPAIIGIENANGISCFIDFSSDWPTVVRRLAELETNICLCDEQFFHKCVNCSDLDVAVEPLIVSNRNILFLQFKKLALKCKEVHIDGKSVDKSSRILFSAMTSGTCGAARLIGVTYKSFWPNVVAFSQMYGVSSEDVIFVTSPPTFDPFMIDIAIALSHGATLLTVGQSVRLAPHQLLILLFPSEGSKPKHSKCSIMQTTPSLFMRWTSKEIAERVMCPASSLRVLALGGEAFPSIGTIERWQDWNGRHRKRIFNLYGLTEMSCWASAYEVTSDDIISKRPIPIGKPLDSSTRFELTSNGELVLKTNVRKCYQSSISDAEVLNHSIELSIHTGDVFIKRNDNELIFKGRTNAVVKVFGRKVDLSKLEAIAGSVENVCQVSALYDAERHIVMICVVADVAVETEEIKNKILNALQSGNVDVVCEIFRVERMPLSAHGKISKSLHNFNSKSLADVTTVSHSDVFLHLLNKSLGATVSRVHIESDEKSSKRLKDAIRSSFHALGGTSLKAMHLLNAMEQRFQTQFPRLLPLMLNEAVSIAEIVEDLEKSSNSLTENIPSSAAINELNDKTRELWSVDLKKCIDATPSILYTNGTTIVSVGSHSKLLCNVRASDGVLISSIELPDRIESQVTQYDDTYAMVGCYDGFLYCFDVTTGKICWKFHSGGMIKCKVLIMSGLAIFGNYSDVDDNLWCVNGADGKLRWSKRIGTKSIFSNPIQVSGTDFIVCTLNGSISRLDATDGIIKWTIETEVAIFSTPLLVNAPKKDFIISAAVNGSVGCWDGEKNLTWSHEIDGNIFSSFDCSANDEQKTGVDVIFGSHNHHLYCLAFDTETEMCSERWKRQTAAPIRATPRFFEFQKEKSIFCCSTNGDVNIFGGKSGTICRRFTMGGEIYSTPAIEGNCAIIGSRNNLLYCFDLK